MYLVQLSHRALICCGSQVAAPLIRSRVHRQTLYPLVMECNVPPLTSPLTLPQTPAAASGQGSARRPSLRPTWPAVLAANLTLSEFGPTRGAKMVATLRPGAVPRPPTFCQSVFSRIQVMQMFDAVLASFRPWKEETDVATLFLHHHPWRRSRPTQRCGQLRDQSRRDQPKHRHLCQAQSQL